MSTKKQIFIGVFLFLLGITSGFLLTRYLFPEIGSIRSNLNGEKIYQITSSNCKKEEEISQKPCSLFVDVSGALRDPGVYCLDDGSLVIDAIKKANGMSNGVSLAYVSKYLNLAQKLVTNQKIYIPSKEEVLCELKPLTLKVEEIVVTPIVEETEAPAQEIPVEETPKENNCININTATKEELDSLVGIGPSTADKIILARPFTKIEDLLNVSGIGEATLNKFKNEICL